MGDYPKNMADSEELARGIDHFKIANFGCLCNSLWANFCKIDHSVLAQLARIDDDDEYERSPVNNNSQFELARSHTDSDLELEFSSENFEIRKCGKVVSHFINIKNNPHLGV